MKSFRELSDDSGRLEKNDIFFVDVGPVIEGHEADIGETFVLKPDGANENELDSLAEASRKVWRKAAEKWRNDRFSGINLYRFANEYAQSLGYQLNPLMAGHRLGDFPHALYSKDRLSSVELVPSENLWVLEIHILSSALRRGAFFEDILRSSV